eukprot:gene7093-197_t
MKFYDDIEEFPHFQPDKAIRHMARWIARARRVGHDQKIVIISFHSIEDKMQIYDRRVNFPPHEHDDWKTQVKGQPCRRRQPCMDSRPQRTYKRGQSQMCRDANVQQPRIL